VSRGLRDREEVSSRRFDGLDHTGGFIRRSDAAHPAQVIAVDNNLPPDYENKYK
jgi:hypothetical protein